MSIIDTIFSYLPTKRKLTPSGWIKFNAVCCQHNGNTADTRGRGGIIKNADGISYHCFNCGHKASYQPGRHLTRKMRALLGWLGAPDDVISKLAMEALKIEADQKALEEVSLPVFEDRPLPEDSILLCESTVSEETIPAIEYIYNRGLTLDDYPFYVSPSMPDRIIVPFYFEGRLVGNIARKLSDGKPRYITNQQPGYVFNLDNQNWDRTYVIVVEGSFDAISVGGVAILGADIMDKQAMLINRLQKQVILVPDRDKDGLRTVSKAIELGWSVSMPPDWAEDIKDSNDAVRRYGKLYTINSIIQAAESYAVKIQILTNEWFKKVKEKEKDNNDNKAKHRLRL